MIDFFNQAVDGDFEMNPQCYPDVSALVEQVKKGSGAELMVSLWPDIKPSSKSYANMAANKCIADGTADPTSAHCRDLMWKQYLKPNYYDKGVKTFWLDETDFMKHGLSCGDASFCGRIWYVSTKLHDIRVSVIFLFKKT